MDASSSSFSGSRWQHAWSAGWAWGSLAGLLGGVMLLAGFWLAHQTGTSQAERMADRLAAAVAQDLERIVEHYDLTLRTVMSGDRTPASLDLNPQQRNALLFERTPRERGIAFLDILDANGNALATLRPDEPAGNWVKQDYFYVLRQSLAKELFVGQPFSPEHENSVGFTISRRITATDGRFAGVAVIGIRLALLREQLSRYSLGPDASVALLREDGLTLMRLPFDIKDIGHPFEPDAPFQAFARNGLPPYTARGPVDHAARIFAFRRIGSYPLVVAAAVPLEESQPFAWVWWLAGATIAIGVIGTLVLLTRQWRLEKHHRRTAERESREKSRFLTMLSHELRTPLHGVLGYADQLSRDSGLNTDQSRHVAQIVRSARHMRDVVNVVLDYARVEARGPTPHMRRTNVLQLAKDCLAVVAQSAAARGLETRCITAPGTPAEFVTDDVQLRQILMNLLSNAVKYTVAGAVELRLKGDGTHLTIEVADTGIGIPEWQRHRLFNEYERFGTERTSIEGTGLGLAIAHRLALQMGGRMGHRDNAGGGSVFWLELPVGIPDETAPAAVATAAPERPLNVLVVDDSEINRDVAMAFLHDGGHAAVAAKSGSEAVTLVATGDFDVVLMDMCMAGVDGLEATRQIRALAPPRGRVPIVAVTANALDQHVEECRRAGMSEHLAKPFTQAELLAVVVQAATGTRSIPEVPNFLSPDDLIACVGPDTMDELLDRLALRIETLIRKLDDPAPCDGWETLAALAHELKGTAGTLGFLRLSAAAADFHAAIQAQSAEAAHIVTEMRREAEQALAELRRRRAIAAMLPA